MITAARWLPDSDRVLVLALRRGGPERRERDELLRRWVGRTSPNCSSCGSLSWGNRPLLPVSPDGRFVAASVASGEVLLRAARWRCVEGAAGSGASEIPIQWTADGRGLLLFNPATLPARISEIYLESGRRHLFANSSQSPCRGLWHHAGVDHTDVRCTPMGINATAPNCTGDGPGVNGFEHAELKPGGGGLYRTPGFPRLANGVPRPYPPRC